MTIIETISEFETFLEQSKNYDWIIVPTYCNGSRPVYTDSISIVYIYVLYEFCRCTYIVLYNAIQCKYVGM